MVTLLPNWGGGAQFTLSPEIERERRTGFLALE